MDSPSDIIVLDGHDDAAKYIVTTDDIRVARYKADGATAFKHCNYSAAALAFQQALSYRLGDSLRAVLLLNRAACDLKIGRHGRAQSTLVTLQSSPQLWASLSPAQQQKALFRLATAHYARQHFQRAEIALCRMQEQFGPSAEATSLHQAVQARLKEATSGAYDWAELSKSSPSDVSDYICSRITVRPVLSAGKGLFAAGDIAAGTLLMLCRPLALSRHKLAPNVRALNMSAEKVESRAQSALATNVFRAALDDADVAARLLDLYAGPSFGQDSSEQHVTPSYDVGRIEAVCTYNAFALSSTSDDETDSALYILPSRCNHSCLPNAIQSFANSIVIIRACTHIQEGSEITISYADPTATLSERQERLSSHGFRCHCELCRFQAGDVNVSGAVPDWSQFVQLSRMCMVASEIAARASIVGALEQAKAGLKMIGLPSPSLLAVSSYSIINIGQGKHLDALYSASLTDCMSRGC